MLGYLHTSCTCLCVTYMLQSKLSLGTLQKFRAWHPASNSGKGKVSRDNPSAGQGSYGGTLLLMAGWVKKRIDIIDPNKLHRGVLSPFQGHWAGTHMGEGRVQPRWAFELTGTKAVLGMFCLYWLEPRTLRFSAQSSLVLIVISLLNVNTFIFAFQECDSAKHPQVNESCYNLEFYLK